MKKANVNENCIGCGLCASMCPEVFQLKEDEQAEVCGEVTDENVNEVQGAIDGCPVEAISWVDDTED